ncbi:MAG: 16S rRNA (adenine(1518)-N(6)/adenine(1519)-N(6))-dimethyltransferase RsmA [Rhodospirillales bacterium]
MPETGLDGLPPLREVIANHGLNAKKSLGQNFLLDLNLTSKIARTASDLANSDIVEIGPGPGGLTRALLAEGARHVYAIERDERCLAALAMISEAYPDRLTVIPGDALTVDIGSIGTAPRRIVSNLPYNIATPLLLRWLHQINAVSEFVLMFQSEVADRLAAQPGTKAYGRLSIIAQWLCDVRRAFSLPPRAFTPPPKVDSAVVVLAPRPAPLAPAEFQALEIVTQAAFGQRRKMLRSSLRSLSLDLEALGIDPSQRAENLEIEAFCRLANALMPRR